LGAWRSTERDVNENIISPEDAASRGYGIGQ